MDKLVYSVSETGKMLGIGKIKVYNLIKTGVLPAINIGGLKVRKTAIDNFLSQYEGCDLKDPANIKAIK